MPAAQALQDLQANRTSYNCVLCVMLLQMLISAASSRQGELSPVHEASFRFRAEAKGVTRRGSAIPQVQLQVLKYLIALQCGSNNRTDAPNRKGAS